MKLLIDIGNTRIKYVLSDNGLLSAIYFVEANTLSLTWLQQTFTHIDQCLVSNVNNKGFNELITQWCEVQQIECLILQSEAELFGIRSGYKEYKTLGVDRWLALLGTAKLYPNQSSLIIDTGTATTVDFIASCGQHYGGWILPGINTLVSSVVNKTNNVAAQCQRVDKVTFSMNTSDAVNNASWAATLGCINEAILLTKNDYIETDNVLNVIITGGNGKPLSHLLTTKNIFVENLIFCGMQCYLTE